MHQWKKTIIRNNAECNIWYNIIMIMMIIMMNIIIIIMIISLSYYGETYESIKFLQW